MKQRNEGATAAHFDAERPGGGGGGGGQCSVTCGIRLFPDSWDFVAAGGKSLALKKSNEQLTNDFGRCVDETRMHQASTGSARQQLLQHCLQNTNATNNNEIFMSREPLTLKQGSAQQQGFNAV